MSRPDLERHGAQALLATYVQMASYAQLARSLQQTRERSIERRLDQATSVEDVYRLQQQLDAQQSQGVALEGAVGRFQVESSDLLRFGEAGLDYEDFEELGLGGMVTREAILAARARREQELSDEAKAEGGEAGAREGTEAGAPEGAIEP